MKEELTVCLGRFAGLYCNDYFSRQAKMYWLPVQKYYEERTEQIRCQQPDEIETDEIGVLLGFHWRLHAYPHCSGEKISFFKGEDVHADDTINAYFEALADCDGKDEKEQQLQKQMESLMEEYGRNEWRGFSDRAEELWQPLHAYFVRRTAEINEHRPETIARIEIAMAWKLYACFLLKAHLTSYQTADYRCYETMSEYLTAMDREEWYLAGADLMEDPEPYPEELSWPYSQERYEKFVKEYESHGFTEKAEELWRPLGWLCRKEADAFRKDYFKELCPSDALIMWGVYQCLNEKPHSFTEAEEECGQAVSDYFRSMTQLNWKQAEMLFRCDEAEKNRSVREKKLIGDVNRLIETYRRSPVQAEMILSEIRKDQEKYMPADFGTPADFQLRAETGAAWMIYDCLRHQAETGKEARACLTAIRSWFSRMYACYAGDSDGFGSDEEEK